MKKKPAHDALKLKELVKARYNELAMQKIDEAAKCCCNPAAPSKNVFTTIAKYKAGNVSIQSITVTGVRPLQHIGDLL